jgi:ribosomal protein L6P/L9E
VPKVKNHTTAIIKAAKPALTYTWRSIITPAIIGILIAIFGGWGFSAIMTQQNFDFTIDIKNQTISFEFGAALPYPVEIHADGKAYVQDVPLRVYLEAQGYTVEWRDGEIYAFKQ